MEVLGRRTITFFNRMIMGDLIKKMVIPSLKAVWVG